MSDAKGSAEAGRVRLRQGDINVAQDGHVLIVTLNRPEKLNALSRAMQYELEEIMLSADADKSVRVILITGTGEAFCAGADVGSLKEQGGRAPPEAEVGVFPGMTPRLAQIFTPSICAVNGMCASAGLHFVSECDIAIASERAVFLDTHANVGQVCSMEPIGLSRRMPLGPLLRMVLLGRAERLDAQQALNCHLVSEVVAHDDLTARALELAHTIAKLSPSALQRSLKAIWTSFEMPLWDAYVMAHETLMRHRDHPDAAEGPRAFLEKRDPVWAAD